MWQLAWPWMLLLLPVPWLVRRYASPDPMDKDAALRVPLAAEFATATGVGRLGGAKPWRLVLLSVVWLLVVLAAARPQHVGEPIALPMTGRDLLMAVDLSGSMEERDFQLNGEWVDRLTATKAVARDFIERRVGDRIGLILFGRETYLQTPLTFDRATVQTLLDEAVIGLAGTETAIGDAIGLAIKTLTEAEIDEGRRVLILLTDGANTAGEVAPLKAAELAQQIGLRIYTIGIGAEQLEVSSLIGGRRNINPSADLDEETLTGIAEMTGGRYFRAVDTAALQDIYRLVDELEPVAEPEAGFRPVKSLYYVPLAGAFALAALLCLVSVVRSIRLHFASRESIDAV